MAPDGFSLSLLSAAAGVALVHSLLGPDHFLPFLTLGRARRWSRWRAAGVTALCGVGHVASSVLLGGVGILLGVAVGSLETVEAVRGDIAAGLLIVFGLAYAAWGLRHHHIHSAAAGKASVWVLFVVFVLGPCEPLIPIFMLPASRGRWGLALGAALLFAVVTVATMVLVVLVGRAGFARVRSRFLERWAHALAGTIVALSGVAILVLGL